MHPTYNATNSQYAVPPTRLTWGGQGGVDSARYYASPTFISRDPMFEKYPSISPYTYCANNPMKLVDPSGRDWYESTELNQNGERSICWRDGNDATIDVKGESFRNIGDTYSQKNKDGSFTNYYQNIGFTSDKEFNAKDEIIKSGQVGKYIGNKSKLSESAKIDLFAASIYHAQGKFILGTAKSSAIICTVLGDALLGAGLLTAYIPGMQEFSASCVGIGNNLSGIGTGINTVIDISNGDVKNASINIAAFLLGYSISNSLGRSSILEGNHKNFLDSQSQIIINIFSTIIQSGTDQKKKE